MRLRSWAWLAAAGAFALPAQAQLSCEQLVASAQAGIALRDQGASLNRVLAETEKGGIREQLRPEDLELLRRVIRVTYTGEASLHELAESCAASRGQRR